MRLNKRDLARKLGVSERILTTWQDQGMPVLEHGRRGQGNAYDLAAVVAWIKRTGHGLAHRAGRPPINIAAIEQELGLAPASPAGGDVLSELLDEVFIDWAAELVRLGMDPEEAIEAMGRLYNKLWLVGAREYGPDWEGPAYGDATELIDGLSWSERMQNNADLVAVILERAEGLAPPLPVCALLDV